MSSGILLRPHAGSRNYETGFAHHLWFFRAKHSRLASGLPVAHAWHMTIRAKVYNHRIELPPEFVIADGAEVEITVPDVAPSQTLAERLAPFIGAVHSGVGDLADNHDHYLYGAPKQKP
jgi:hypothetical protein